MPKWNKTETSASLHLPDVLGIADGSDIDVDVDGILTFAITVVDGVGDWTAELVDVGEPTSVVVIVGMLSSPGVLRLESTSGNRFSTSVSKSSKRPMRWFIRCISCFDSTLMSCTLESKSRWTVFIWSRSPFSYASNELLRTLIVSRSSEAAFSSLAPSRSDFCFSNVLRRSDFESSVVSSMVSWRANEAGLADIFWSFGKTLFDVINENKCFVIAHYKMRVRHFDFGSNLIDEMPFPKQK